MHFSVFIDILFVQKGAKLLPPDTFLCLKIYFKNAFAARALPRTPLGELTALPRLPGWIRREGRGKAGGRKQKEWEREAKEGERKGKGNERKGQGLSPKQQAWIHH